MVKSNINKIKERRKMKIAILFYSKTGHTLEAANAIAEGIKSQGSKVDLININSLEISVLKNYDGIIVGSPCWAGVISTDGVAGPMKKALRKIPNDIVKGKIGGVFSVYALSGVKNTIKTLSKTLTNKGFKNVIVGPIAKAGTPFSITKGSSVSKEDIELYKNFGKTFVQ